jgi:N-acetyl-anhydromuramyl-L-alanine amidase AmpD
VPTIHEAHLKKAWDGIGYHFVIGNGSGMGDGEIEPTFRWREQMHGAHAGKNEYNQHGIGICLVGNFQETHPSEAQLASVKRLVATLKHEYQVPSENVIAHRDVKATACPGKNFPMAEVGSSHLVPLFSGTGSPAFEVATDTFANPATTIQLAAAKSFPKQTVQSQFDEDAVDTAERRPVR